MSQSHFPQDNFCISLSAAVSAHHIWFISKTAWWVCWREGQYLICLNHLGRIGELAWCNQKQQHKPNAIESQSMLISISSVSTSPHHRETGGRVELNRWSTLRRHRAQHTVAKHLEGWHKASWCFSVTVCLNWFMFLLKRKCWHIRNMEVRSTGRCSGLNQSWLWPLPNWCCLVLLPFDMLP